MRRAGQLDRARPDAFDRNVDLEFQRNRERFAFLRWGQQAFSRFKVCLLYTSDAADE